MGQCVKCGKETPHSYTYFSGKQVNQTSQWAGYNQTRVTTTYGDITPHTEYLCGKHVHTPSFAAFSALFLPFMAILALIIYSRQQGNATATAGVIIFFAILALGCAAGAFYYGRKLFLNKRIKDEAAANALIFMAKKKDNTLTYFTPTEWKNLK